GGWSRTATGRPRVFAFARRTPTRCRRRTAARSRQRTARLSSIPRSTSGSTARARSSSTAGTWIRETSSGSSAWPEPRSAGAARELVAIRLVLREVAVGVAAEQSLPEVALERAGVRAEHGAIQVRGRVNEPDERLDGPRLDRREVERSFVGQPGPPQHLRV